MEISTKIGFGGKFKGEIVFIPGEILPTHTIDTTISGKILVTACWVGREFVEKAELIGAAGIVVPSIHWRDFNYFQKNLSCPLLVILKFGKLNADLNLADKLLKLNGKKGEIDGETKILRI